MNILGRLAFIILYMRIILWNIKNVTTCYSYGTLNDLYTINKNAWGYDEFLSHCLCILEDKQGKIKLYLILV